MSAGLLLGFATAMAIGASDVLAAIASRRIGAAFTALGAMAISLVMLGIVVQMVGAWPVSGLTLPLWRVLLPGIAAGLAYMAFVISLRLGPIAVVGPVTGVGGLVTVLLAFLLLGDRPMPLQWAAVPLAAAGAGLASVRAARGRLQLVGKGPLFAAIAVLCQSLYTVMLTGPAQETGALPAILLARTSTVALIGVAVLATRAARASSSRATARAEPRRHRLATPAILLSGGILNAGGSAAFALGVAEGPTWLVGLAAATSPVMVISAGLLLFKERLALSQWIGVSLVAFAFALILASGN